jgi:transposase
MARYIAFSEHEQNLSALRSRGDAAELLRLLSELRAKAERHVNAAMKITCIQEIGFDGFWIHRVLAANGIESHVVEAATIAVPRRHRRAKTDTIDGELLLRTLMAFKRGEPRVCAMVVVPTPEEEDRRLAFTRAQDDGQRAN